MKQPGEEELSDVESVFNESGEDSELEIEGMPDGMELDANLELVDKSIRKESEKKKALQKAKRRQKQHEKKKLKVSTPRNKVVGCSLVLSSGGVYRYGQITEVLASDQLLARVETYSRFSYGGSAYSASKGKWRLIHKRQYIMKYGDSKEALCLWLLVRIC